MRLVRQVRVDVGIVLFDAAVVRLERVGGNPYPVGGFVAVSATVYWKTSSVESEPL